MQAQTKESALEWLNISPMRLWHPFRLDMMPWQYQKAIKLRYEIRKYRWIQTWTLSRWDGKISIVWDFTVYLTTKIVLEDFVSKSKILQTMKPTLKTVKMSLKLRLLIRPTVTSYLTDDFTHLKNFRSMISPVNL